MLGPPRTRDKKSGATAMNVDIQKIADCGHANNSMVDSVIRSPVDDLRTHPSITEAIRRLSGPSPKLSYHEIMDNSDRRVSVVGSFKNWNVSVIMDYVVDGEIALSPYPIIISPLGGAQLEIDIYECPIEYFSRSLNRDLRLSAPIERKMIADGEFWATPAKGVFADVVGVTASDGERESAVLVISGDAYAPYVRTFDRSGNMTSTVFSSSKFNGQQFFADFLKNLTSSNLLSVLSEKEANDLYGFVKGQLSDPEAIVSEAVWPMIQAAAKIDRSSGLNALQNLADSSHEMAIHAMSLLNKVSLEVEANTNA